MTRDNSRADAALASASSRWSGLSVLRDAPDVIRRITPADPLAVARAILSGCVAGVRVLAQHGTEWAGHLFDLVTVRPGERAALAPPLLPVGSQAEVDEAKFQVGGGGGRQPPEQARGQVDELPCAYDREHLVLLPRDPWTLFVYWEIGPGTRIEAIRALGAEAQGAREVLRVYDVTFVTPAGDPACLAFDVEPTPGKTSAYVEVSRAGASYRVEIGVRTPANRFVPMARSNTVTLPAAAPSSDKTVRWVETRPRTHVAVAADAGGRHVAWPRPVGVPPPRSR